MPSQGPSAKVTVDKPDTDTYCPASGKKLKMKDLTPVGWYKPGWVGGGTPHGWVGTSPAG